MKFLYRLICLPALATATLFTGCSKNGASPAAKTYTSSKGTTVSLTTNTWYVTRFTTGNGGTVNLKLEGTTNADKIVLQTHGDGLISDNQLTLTGGKQFSSDGAISFTATSVPTGNFTASTQLTAYKGSDVFVVKLESGELHY